MKIKNIKNYNSLNIYDALIGKKIFIEPELKWVFFFKDQGDKTFLFVLPLNNLKTVEVSLENSKQVSNFDFSVNQSEIVQFDSNTQTLFLAMDEKNNEFNNIYSLKLDLQNLFTENSFDISLISPKQITFVENARFIKSTEKFVYFINRKAIESASFKNEIYRLRRRDQKLQLLVTDEGWQHKIGWGGAKVSADEAQMVVSVDEGSNRKNINFILHNLPVENEDPEVLTQEPEILLKDKFLNQQNYILHLNSKGVYFHSQLSGFENIFYYDLNLKFVKQLTFLDQPGCFVDILEAQGRFAIITLVPNRRQIETRLSLAILNETESEVSFIYSIKKGLYSLSAFHQTWALIRSEYNLPPSYEIFDSNLQSKISFSTYQNQIISFIYEYIEYKTFDGLIIPAYLITPSHHNEITGGLIESFYGGTSRFRSDFYTYLNSGYAVLSPAVRGSWGFGKEWESKLIGDLGGKEILDLHAGAFYLAEKFPQIKNKIGLFGGSHGGYAVLRALTLPPEFVPEAPRFNFVLGVCECGFADLVSFYKDSRIADWLKYFLGDLESNYSLYLERSPLSFTEYLKSPLFVIHGLNDSRVPYSTMDKFIEILKKDTKNKHEILIHPQGGHHQNTPADLKAEQMKVLNFLNLTFKNQSVEI